MSVPRVEHGRGGVHVGRTRCNHAQIRQHASIRRVRADSAGSGIRRGEQRSEGRRDRAAT
jgi:hypothetical protein